MSTHCHDLPDTVYTGIVTDAMGRQLTVGRYDKYQPFFDRAVARLKAADALLCEAVDAATCTETTCSVDEHAAILSQADEVFNRPHTDLQLLEKRYRLMMVVACVSLVLGLASVAAAKMISASLGMSPTIVLFIGGMISLISGAWIQFNSTGAMLDVELQLFVEVPPGDYAAVLRALDAIKNLTGFNQPAIAATRILYGAPDKEINVLKFLAIMVAVQRARIRAGRATELDQRRKLDEFISHATEKTNNHW